MRLANQKIPLETQLWNHQFHPRFPTLNAGMLIMTSFAAFLRRLSYCGNPIGSRWLLMLWATTALWTSSPNAVAEPPHNSSPTAPPPLVLEDGNTVLFLGDTLIERENTFGSLEYRLTIANPKKRIVFRNLGWSADLPTGRSRASFDWIYGEPNWITNLLAQIAAVKPDVVFLGYGMSASFNGQSGIQTFADQMGRLIDGIQKQSTPKTVRFAIWSPITHEDLGRPLPDPESHNRQLAAYTEALRALANSRHIPFLDLFQSFRHPKGAPTTPAWTDNGIHPNELGYRVLAEEVGKWMQYFEPSWAFETQNSRANAGGDSKGMSRISTSQERKTPTGYAFTGTPIQLPLPPSQTLKGVSPVPAPRIQVGGLTGKHYVLRIDGKDILTASASDWAKGVPLTKGPFMDQAAELQAAILKKNELVFNRWRPENSTYLFLFRKHEQGQNAKEIPQFDPLIAEQEARIEKLKISPSYQFELVEVPKSYVVQSQGDSAPASAKTPTTHSMVPSSDSPLPSFELPEGYEINLFAESPLLYKPIHMNFDSQGRLWIASSSVYPQIKPGQTADDSIVVLEDRDGDGKAETSRIFAEGLLIPTGVEPGDGGVYVGQSTELLHFKDTDGDGKADVRKVVLSGFGTEDTHHILHTLHWGMDGQLYMNQSIYIHTHTETPNGVVHLNSGGILNLRPSTLEMGIHMKGLVNTWGHQFDLYGQSFATDGAGGEGINYIVPQAMYVTYAGARRILGSVSPGAYPKFCSLEILYSPLFPADWQGNMITCDFRAHRVVRFAISEQGSAYVTQEMPDLIRSKDASFRPIDIKLGPDGGLYIADWSNPIIQHGEVDFRDPRRDKEHGRIWRLMPKSKKPLPHQDLATASNEALLAHLTGESGFHREKARRVLAERGSSILKSVDRWASKSQDERAKLEALWLHQSVDVVNAPLLQGLLESKDPHIRAAAVRVLSFWRHRVSTEFAHGETRKSRFLTPAELSEAQLKAPLDLLAARVADTHPRVRMEALRALAKFPTPKAAELALTVLNQPLDPHLEYALWLTINDLAEPWLKAIQSGQWKWDGKENQLEYGLRAIEPAQAGAVLSQILAQHPLEADGRGKWIEIIGQSGGPKELRSLYDQVLAQGFNESASARALTALAQAARLRRATPSGDVSSLSKLFEAPSEAVRIAAVRLAGAWKLRTDRIGNLASTAQASSTSPALAAAILETLREIGGKTALDALTQLSENATTPAVQRQAVIALAALQLDTAAPHAVRALMRSTTEVEATELWRGLLGIKGAAGVLTKALPHSGISPVVAKAGLRATRESGRQEPDLVLALTRGADLTEGEATLTDAELKSMATAVVQQGDPVRGEKVYRRTQLGCTGCHSIGGAGGKVGPDMTSIGASAPVDYLIESVWFPNRKVKEGFHSLLLETKDGSELSGILVREDTDSLVLRDTLGNEVSVAKNSIEKRTTGGSLMPAGLIDGISPNERLDLFRFLSELGKPGPFDASKASVARGWKLRPGNHQDEQFGVEKMVQLPLDAPGWIKAWSTVDGRLQKADIQESAKVGRYTGLIGVYAATRLQIPDNSEIELKLEDIEGANLWLDGKPLAAGPSIRTSVSSGTHTLMLRLDPKHLPENLRVSTSKGTFVMP